ncbi:hypothetical protein ACFWV1_33060 [Streptomyces sp. NPDC058700]|uniref:hypothetical protein n=1 Tax=unclassified Streptomyces TaxID=2593676 RepID=UPI003659BAF2
MTTVRGPGWPGMRMMISSAAVAAALLALAVPATATTAPADTAQPSASTQPAHDTSANQFFDQLMADMRRQAPVSGLDPMRLRPFKIKIKANGSTNRDVKADFTQGSLTGLASLTRQNDCAYGVYGSMMKMGCYVSLQPVAALMNADVTGDSNLGNTHEISTSTSISPDTFALIEITGPRGSQARLDRITVKAVTMTTSVTKGKFDLDSSRFNQFARQTNHSLARQVTLSLQADYAHVLATVLAGRVMP